MKAITAEDKKAIKEKNSKKNQAPKKDISKSEKNMSSTMRIAILGMLAAIMFLMAFTPIGYVPIGVLKVTFMTIPVIVAAAILTPADAAIIGGIFGLTSFIQAVSGMSALTGALFQLSPILTFILCVVPRALEGFLGGLIFQGVKKLDKTGFISYGVTGLAVPIMNTLFFMSTLFLLFYQSEPIQNIASSKGADNVLALFTAMVGVQAVVEAVVCFVVGTAVSKALAVALKKVKK